MTKVITYGTFDLLHHGHIRLLQRAKALGDYLIVGVTSDMFDRQRGKINVTQSLIERIDALKALGFVNKIIVEEYEGQKIDDIKKFDVDIFAIGSDWKGKFDYLKDSCNVVYLDRTEGISSSQIRSGNNTMRFGLVGNSPILNKVYTECQHVNGIVPIAACTDIPPTPSISNLTYKELLLKTDAVFIVSHPTKHYAQIKEALQTGHHVICESPVTINSEEYDDLITISRKNGTLLFDAIKTAYSRAYHQLLLLAKSGVIGEIVSVEATCTSLRDSEIEDNSDNENTWNSICAWGPTAMLPIFQLLGGKYISKTIITQMANKNFDNFTKIDFVYPHSTATIRVGKGSKSEGCLIISGTKGYIYVPAPWWKTDYFEIKYENPNNNKRYFYQLEGEGIRNMLSAFVRASIKPHGNMQNIDYTISRSIIRVIEDFNNRINTIFI